MVHASVMACGDTSLGAAGPSLGVNLTIMLVAEHWDTCIRSGAAHAIEDEPSLGASPLIMSVVKRNTIWTAPGTVEISLGVSLATTAVAECRDTGVLSMGMRDFGTLHNEP